MDQAQRDFAIDAEAVTPLLRERRSIRRYQDGAIDDAQVRRLIAAATCAPSAHNRQPWRFAVLRDHESKARLAKAMGERLRADRKADGDAQDAIERDAARSYARITQAPLVIVAGLTLADMDMYPDGPRSAAELTMAVQSTAMAVQNLLLEAHAMGLGACWMCAPLFCPQVVREAIGAPAEWQAQALVTVGYTADAGKPFTRKSIDAVMWVPR